MNPDFSPVLRRDLAEAMEKGGIDKLGKPPLRDLLNPFNYSKPRLLKNYLVIFGMATAAGGWGGGEMAMLTGSMALVVETIWYFLDKPLNY